MGTRRGRTNKRKREDISEGMVLFLVTGLYYGFLDGFKYGNSKTIPDDQAKPIWNKFKKDIKELSRQKYSKDPWAIQYDKRSRK